MHVAMTNLQLHGLFRICQHPVTLPSWDVVRLSSVSRSVHAGVPSTPGLLAFPQEDAAAEPEAATGTLVQQMTSFKPVQQQQRHHLQQPHTGPIHAEPKKQQATEESNKMAEGEGLLFLVVFCLPHSLIKAASVSLQKDA